MYIKEKRINQIKTIKIIRKDLLNIEYFLKLINKL